MAEDDDAFVAWDAAQTLLAREIEAADAALPQGLLEMKIIRLIYYILL